MNFTEFLIACKRLKRDVKKFNKIVFRFQLASITVLIWFQLGVNSISIRFSLDVKKKKFKRALKGLLEAVLSDAFNKYPPKIQLLVGPRII